MKFKILAVFFLFLYQINADVGSDDNVCDDEIYLIKYFNEKTIKILESSVDTNNNLKQLSNRLNNQQNDYKSELQNLNERLKDNNELMINTSTKYDQCTLNLQNVQGRLNNQHDDYKSELQNLNERLKDNNELLINTSTKYEECTIKLQNVQGRLNDQIDSYKLQLQNVNDRFTKQTESMEILQKKNDELVLELDSLKYQHEKLKIKLPNVTTWTPEAAPRLYRSKRQNFINQSNLNSNCTTESCDWTVIQRREDSSENFDRTWNDYKTGFGNPLGEFFIGLEKLHNLTTLKEPQELLIIIEDFENDTTRYARYDQFEIGSESTKYVLKNLGTYDGNAGDLLEHHMGKKFSTRDQDNDENHYNNIAEIEEAGWWFSELTFLRLSNLNGLYVHEGWLSTFGISYEFWDGTSYYLKFVEMMIRPKT